MEDMVEHSQTIRRKLPLPIRLHSLSLSSPPKKSSASIPTALPALVFFAPLASSSTSIRLRFLLLSSSWRSSSGLADNLVSENKRIREDLQVFRREQGSEEEPLEKQGKWKTHSPDAISPLTFSTNSLLFSALLSADPSPTAATTSKIGPDFFLLPSSSESAASSIAEGGKREMYLMEFG